MLSELFFSIIKNMGRNFIFVLVLGVLGLFLFWMNSPTHLDAELANPDAGYPHMAKRRPSQVPDHQTPEPPQVAQVLPAEPMQRTFNMASRLPASIPPVMPEMRDLKSLTLAALQPKWKIWNRITAVENQTAATDSHLSVIGTINGYALVKTGNDMSLENFETERPVVLFDERLQTAGVLTGTLSFHLKNNGELNHVMNDYALKMIQSFGHMNLYYVTSSSIYFDLKKLFSALNQDKRLENVTLEILSKNYEKK